MLSLPFLPSKATLLSLSSKWNPLALPAPPGYLLTITSGSAVVVLADVLNHASTVKLSVIPLSSLPAFTKLLLPLKLK